MDAFEYLSVLLSVILGLAVTQVLQGLRAMMLARSGVRLYAPSLIWAATLILIAVQSWWAMFGLSDRQAWDFASFAMVLLQTVVFYLWSGLVLPDFRPGEPLDLKDHYHRERPWFFGLAIATLVASLMKDVVLDGRLPQAGNVAFHLVLIAMSAVAIVWRREVFHQINAPLVAASVVGYVAILFANL